MARDPPADAFGGAEGQSGRRRSIIEAVRDGVFVVDLDGTVTYVNDALEEITGQDRGDLIGTTFETLVESELVDAAEFDRFVAAIEDIAAGHTQDRRLTFRIGDGRDRVVEVRVSKHDREDRTGDIVGVVRDVTERERRVRTAERNQAALASLYEIGADTSLTFEEKANRILAIGCEYLDLPFGFLTRVREGDQEIVHAVGDHELLQPGESAPLKHSYCRKTIDSDGLVGMRNARNRLGPDDSAYELFELGCYIGTKVIVGETLYGTFCFAGPEGREKAFSEGEREVVKLLGQWAGYELERQLFEERLEGLHGMSQQLLAAETTAAVGQLAVDTSSDLFELPVTACWAYDAATDTLHPLAETDRARDVVGPAPTFQRGEALVWDSFDSGEIRSYEDLRDDERAFNPETAVRSEVHVPCGDHAIVTSAATEPRAFDDVDIESLRLLGALVTEAFTAVKRERRLAERGETLQAQNERLEEFADVVAHDLRNPLAGAVSSLEVARDTDEERFFERTEQSLERMDDLIEELLDIARGDRQPVEVRTLSVAATAREAWQYVDTTAATLSIPEDPGVVRADETRLLQLFGNLLRNCVEHAGPAVNVTVGPLAEGAGFYVADDGPGLPEGTREDVLTLGSATAESGTGIGLESVSDIVDAHGWTLSIPETDGGARFEIRTDGPESTPVAATFPPEDDSP